MRTEAVRQRFWRTSAVETLLVDIIRQEEHAMSICTVLKRWREWSDRGGMTSSELEYPSASRRALWASSEECVQEWKARRAKMRTALEESSTGMTM